MFGKVKARWLLTAILGAAMCQASTGADQHRKVVNRVQPCVSRTGTEMNVTGTVKIEVVIAANGSVKSREAARRPPAVDPVGQRSTEEMAICARPGDDNHCGIPFPPHRLTAPDCEGAAMTISKKLYLNFGAILALLLVLFIVNITAVQREHAARASASRALELAQEGEAVRFQMMQNRLYLRNYLLSGDSREVDTMNEGIARLHRCSRT